MKLNLELFDIKATYEIENDYTETLSKPHAVENIATQRSFSLSSNGYIVNPTDYFVWDAKSILKNKTQKDYAVFIENVVLNFGEFTLTKNL